ncbi:hypothetical protein EH223_07955 [candidate division KSB1 bacterium]|nr:alginate lyase family protein [candidate division KSB1 bacterium]RQW04126.1 MAG: hypothetical protein EH223_07955 [candidate division KSB1 bacterium]
MDQLESAAAALAIKASRFAEFLKFYFFKSFDSYTKRFLVKVFTKTALLLHLSDAAKKNRFICETSDNFISLYRAQFPEQAKKIVQTADDVSNHIFDLLGSGPRHVSTRQQIDWHLDFKSGYQWNKKKYFRCIKFREIPGVDIKIPWELSRFQSQMCLAQAFVLTNEIKYAQTFQSQVLHWIKNNPPGFGVNWRSTMDVALRVVNWLVIKEIVDSTYQFPEDFTIQFYSSVYDHARFIRHHFHHVNRITSNHYLSELAGLLFVAIYCPFFTESNAWRAYAINELEKESKIQIYPDGTDYEGSICYHRLVLEILLYCLILAEKNGVYFSDQFKAIVKKMCTVTLTYLKPNGNAPQIGDNDSGQFIKLSRRHSLDHRYILSLAALAFNDGSLKSHDADFAPEALWIYGSSGYEKWRSLQGGHSVATKTALPDSGWYVIKEKNDYMIISCGQNGKMGLGGHAHNDKLSLELMLNGCDIFVDPGTFVYMPDPEKRNVFRSTRSHNTIYFQGIEQNDLAKGVFYLPDTIKYDARVLERNGTYVRFYGKITYQNVTHERRIEVSEKFSVIKIYDRFSATDASMAYLLYHLAPDLVLENHNIVDQRGEKLAHLQVNASDLSIAHYHYSPEYGVVKDAVVITVALPIYDGINNVTTILSKQLKV